MLASSTHKYDFFMESAPFLDLFWTPFWISFYTLVIDTSICYPYS